MSNAPLPDRQPAYRRVYSDLRQNLKSSKYPIGSFLPTEGELEQIYGVSRTTIRRAIAMLVEDGYIRVTQGCGTEVISLPIERYTNVRSISTVSAIDQSSGENILYTFSQKNVSSVFARKKTAEILGVQPGAPLFCLQRVLSTSDNAPVALLVDYLSAELVPDFDLRFSGSASVDLYSFLEEHYDIHYTTSTETITAKAASLLEANTLNVAIGSPLIYCRRKAQCDRGPLEYAYSTYVPNLWQITIDMDVHDYAIISGTSFSAAFCKKCRTDSSCKNLLSWKSLCPGGMQRRVLTPEMPGTPNPFSGKRDACDLK